jgi:hypothetical protein
MPWNCPKCGIMREQSGSFLSSEKEYCTEGVPFTPFVNKKCCVCHGMAPKKYCKSCTLRSQGKSGSNAKHHQKVEYINQGLCPCGKKRGHAFTPGCAIGGTIAYVSRVGEGKVPIHEFAGRAFNITKV